MKSKYDDIYYENLNHFHIKIKPENQYAYDYFLEHLISDTHRMLSKLKKSPYNGYDIVLFKKCFINHMMHSNINMIDKLQHPENNKPFFLSYLRAKKIEQINENDRQD